MKSANKIKIKTGLLMLLIFFLATSCAKESKRKFGIFTVLKDNVTTEMNGTISSRTPKQFDKMIEKYPNIKTINMLNCPGSKDDEANLKVSKKMHDLGIGFHLSSTSEIASGAVDMYVGGIKRTREPGSKIGVHSWGAGKGDPIATSYPEGDAVHLPYINYYVSVGFTQEEAEKFYYFTINAAPAEGMHWMTDEEIETYKITKQ